MRRCVVGASRSEIGRNYGYIHRQQNRRERTSSVFLATHGARSGSSLAADDGRCGVVVHAGLLLGRLDHQDAVLDLDGYVLLLHSWNVCVDHERVLGFWRKQYRRKRVRV